METSDGKVLANTTIDLSNQENARIWSELEQYLILVHQAGGEWLRANAAVYAIMDDLGYEDLDSLEATLGEPFESWVKRLGCLEVKTDEQGMTVFRMKPTREEHQRKSGFTMSLPIRTKQHLQLLCVKSVDATLYIPEIEFSVGTDEKTQIDSIYNHIGGHIFTLELFAQKVDEERKLLILETVGMLRRCLDLDMEWTWVLVDPSGKSEMEETDGLVVHNYIEIPEWGDRNV